MQVRAEDRDISDESIAARIERLVAEERELRGREQSEPRDADTVERYLQ